MLLTFLNTSPPLVKATLLVDSLCERFRLHTSSSSSSSSSSSPSSSSSSPSSSSLRGCLLACALRRSKGPLQEKALLLQVRREGGREGGKEDRKVSFTNT